MGLEIADRFLALLLTAGFSLTGPAFGLRVPNPRDAGLEEELAKALKGGVEELIRISLPVKIPTPLTKRAIDNLLRQLEMSFEDQLGSALSRVHIPFLQDGYVGAFDDAPALFFPEVYGAEQEATIVHFHVFANAVKAIAHRAQAQSDWDEGMIQVTLGREGRTFVLEMSDNGIGFEKPALEKKAFRESFSGNQPNWTGGKGDALRKYYGLQLIRGSGGTLEVDTRRLGSPPEESWRLTYDPSRQGQEFQMTRIERREVGTAIRWRVPSIFTAGLEEKEAPAVESWPTIRAIEEEAWEYDAILGRSP